MSNQIDNLKNKKIAIVGFGKEGRSLANFLFKRNIRDITILDQKKNLKVPSFFKRELGEAYLSNLKEFDIIFLSPGINPHLKEFKGVKKRIFTPTELFFDLFKGLLIGITGTKGKGTTAKLLYQILKKHFRKKREVFLGGNIGKPLINLLEEEKNTQSTLVIAELSSFQLQHLKKSPQIAILTNLEVDHLDYHKSIREYHRAKMNIFRYQRKKDVAILPYSLKKRVKKYKAKKFYFLDKKSKIKEIKKNRNSSIFAYFENGFLKIGGKKILAEKEIKIIGEHIKEDILVASLAAWTLKVPEDTIRAAIKKFKPQPHRLEFICQWKKIKFYNDSASTNPLSTIRAIESFKKEKIFLILGGENKGFDYSRLGKTISKQKNQIEAIFLIGKNKKEIASKIKEKEKIIFPRDLEETIKLIKERTKSESVVLFSPASASFDMFKNYKERGNTFRKIVRKNC